MFFLRPAQSSHRQSLLSIGKSLLKSTQLSQSKTLLTRRTGKAGSSLQRNSVTRFSLSAMTSLLQTQKDLQRVSSLAAVTQFLSSLTRLVRFRKLLRLSKWLTRPATQQFLHTVAVKRQIQQLPTLQLLLTLARLRQVLRAVQSVLQSTISFSELKNSSVTAQFIPVWTLSMLKKTD